MRTLAPLLSASVLVACGGSGGRALDAAPAADAAADAGADAAPDAPADAALDAAVDAAPPPDGPPQAPASLFDTGLCVDPACTAVRPGVRAYDVRWPLWSDGAAKRRWIALPPGAQIDTTDMDWWQFPVGTRAWKEFSVGGKRIETRYIARFGPGPSDYLFMSYQWNDAQDDAVAVPAGVIDASGTTHDIPNRGQCRYCHEGTPGRLLGFAAMQLDTPAGPGTFVLDDLVAAGLLTAPPAGSAAPRFPLPGDATSQAALGYLEANCSHCHNPHAPTHFVTPMSLHLPVGSLGSCAATPAYQTAVGVAGQPVLGCTTIVVPGDPDASIMIARMNSADAARHMPAIGSEVVDPDGQAILRAWIGSLP